MPSPRARSAIQDSDLLFILEHPGWVAALAYAFAHQLVLAGLEPAQVWRLPDLRGSALRSLQLTLLLPLDRTHRATTLRPSLGTSLGPGPSRSQAPPLGVYTEALLLNHKLAWTGQV